MQERAMLMTEGSVKRQIIRFAVPVFWGNLFQQLYNVVDSLIVGNLLGSDALAAVSSSSSIVFLLVGLFSGLFTGASVVIANCFGARDDAAVGTAVHTTVAFGLLSGIALSVIGVFLSPILLRAIGTPESVFPDSVLYFRIYFAGVVFVVLYNTATGIFQAVGDSRHPLYYLLVSSVINVVLDLLFVAGFGMGVDGAALATVISQAASAALGFRRLMRSTGVYRVWIKKIRLNGAMLQRILTMGIPAGLQNSIISIGNIFVQSGLNRYGALAVAGCGVYHKIDGFGFLPITSFALAMTTFIGQNLGAHQIERVKKGARFGILTSIIIAQTIAVVVYITIPWLISAFNSDPEVIRYGTMHGRTLTPFYFLLAFSHAMAGILRGAGRAVVPMLVMAVCWCGVRIVYITLIASQFQNIRVVMIVYPITWTLSSIVFLIYYLKGDWTRQPAIDRRGRRQA